VRAIFLRLSIAAACIAIGSSAWAQNLRSRERTFEASETLAADLRRARIHSGPFYLLSYLQFSDLGYENQFFFPTSEQGGGLSLAIAAPQKLYFVPAKKTVYAISFTPEYAFFSKGASNAWGYLVRGDAHYLLNHLYTNLYAEQSNKLQALSGEINRVVTQRAETVGVAGEFRYSSRTRAFYSASARHFTYPSSRYQPNDLQSIDINSINDLDRRERNGRLSLMHHTFPLTSLTLASEWNKYTFLTAADKDSMRHYVAPGFTYDSGRTSMKGEAGPAVLHFYTPGKDFRGVVGNAQLNHRIGSKMNLTMGADRDVDFSIAAGQRYYLADRAMLALERQASRRLTLRFSSTVGRDLYPVATLNPVSAAFERRDDQFSFTAIGWRYTMRHVRGGFDIGYYQRKSNFAIDEQSGIRLAIALSLSP
jgi:Putative beta-barrel porin 2